MPPRVEARSSRDLLTVTIAREEGLLDLLIATLAVTTMVLPYISIVLVGIVVGVRGVIYSDAWHVRSLSWWLISSRVTGARVQ